MADCKQLDARREWVLLEGGLPVRHGSLLVSAAKS